MDHQRAETKPSGFPSLAADEAARRRRDRELTMSERLERVHRLCAQLATLKPIVATRWS